MKVVFPMPTDALMCEFIIENNAIDHTQILLEDVDLTRTKRGYNPFVAGHLNAMNYGIKYLVKEEQWPADHRSQWESLTKSDVNLRWLTNLHEKLMTPVANFGDRLEDAIKHYDCGRYRITEKSIGLGRKMPKASSIPLLLHKWHIELSEYHFRIRDSLRRPTMPQVTAMAKAAYNLQIKLCCICPFTKGNGVTARLVENLLRLRWGLPWRVPHAAKSQDYINAIMKYEDSSDWKTALSGAV